MIVWIQEQLRDLFGPFNVLRYVSFRVIGATITSIAITMLLYPWFIRTLQRKSVGQKIYELGPQSHQVKAGTPTMGGALLLMAVVVSTLLWVDIANPLVWLVIAAMVLFGIIGFIDDYLKLARGKNHGGLTVKQKLLSQIGAAVILAVVLFFVIGSHVNYNLNLYIPFLRSDKYFLELPQWLYMVMAIIVIVAYSNAVNLTDGLDGLAIGPSIISAAAFLVLCYLTGATLGGFDLSEYLLIPKVEGASELAIVCASLIGAGIGFLWFNSHPAQVFMGDVGSLSIGAGLGTLAVVTKNELLSVIIHGIFVLEAVSVVTQTVSYKLTGKRVFLMAPIHHHFEKKGWKESKIVVRFWIISILLALFALASIKIR